MPITIITGQTENNGSDVYTSSYSGQGAPTAKEKAWCAQKRASSTFRSVHDLPLVVKKPRNNR
jgi:hypothetical protein